ncbi:MAG TPA: 50S ribosomal protein L15 [Candidatus Saccharimonadales bacterium]|nr:50S ribosomal protein L15 [Candidatus Saccharimonadales bacterium]
MKYNELIISRQRTTKRVGRGISAGRGKTAGRGTKGQGSRKSGGVRPGFEGGQMPLYMRLPHLRGFKSRRASIEVVYTGQLEAIRKSIIDNQALFEAGLVSSPHESVKLLQKGELKSKKDVKLQAASESAIALLKKTGGSFTKVDRIARPSKEKTSEPKT